MPAFGKFKQTPSGYRHSPMNEELVIVHVVDWCNVLPGSEYICLYEPGVFTNVFDRKSLVHPGLLWVEAEATAVEEDGCFKVLTVSEATDSSLDGHDFAVHAFGNGVCDSVSAITHDILQTLLD